MPKTYTVLPIAMFLWLLISIVFGWGAVQDDSLIHLRYATNLSIHHFITYDGVHADYGASSLLYVTLLAALRRLSSSADLARGVSSAVHLLLFIGLALGFFLRARNWSAPARIAAMTLLAMLVLPGAVRWLDDGMETGLAVFFAVVLAWLLHGECATVERRESFTNPTRFLAMTALGFMAVLLRTELSLLCGVGFLILLSSRVARRDGADIFSAVLRSMPLLLGAMLAMGLIFATMHTLLPDTALAKSHGIAHWFNPIHDTAVTLGGAMSFGAGMLLFWLVTLAMVLSKRGVSITILLANCLFPVVLALASLRGQEIQGARYFAWTFFFAIVWNILELGQEPANEAGFDARWLLYGFLILLAMELPFEAVAMHRVLIRRAATMRAFEAQHLEVLSQARGVASDIGYIGYFTQAKLCDLAGLVNGRAAARLTSSQRAQACVATDPQFLFLNTGQLTPLARYRDFSTWRVCGRYDFTNVSTPDSHYLIVRPDLAETVCQATGQVAEPLSLLIAQR